MQYQWERKDYESIDGNRSSYRGMPRVDNNHGRGVLLWTFRSCGIYFGGPIRGQNRICCWGNGNVSTKRRERSLQNKVNGSFLFQPIDLASYGTGLFELAGNRCQLRIFTFWLGIAQDDIGICILNAFHPSQYMYHYPTARIIIRELYGSCPFPAGSLWVMDWGLWDAERKRLGKATPAPWNKLPRMTTCCSYCPYDYIDGTSLELHTQHV